LVTPARRPNRRVTFSVLCSMTLLCRSRPSTALIVAVQSNMITNLLRC
jgi:hypothetical protein